MTRTYWLATTCAILTFAVTASVADARDFDRDQLIEAARAEGQLVFYATIPEEQVNLLLRRFQEAYPFIDTSGSFRATSGRLAARIDAEVAASRVQGDVLQMGSLGQFFGYADAGFLGEFYTTEMENYGNEYKEESLWTVFRMSPILMAYHSGRMSADEAPRSWADLKDPKYANSIAFLDATSGGQHSHWIALQDLYGQEFWDEVSANGARAVTGVNRPLDGLLTGEFEVVGHTYGYAVTAYKATGAPVQEVIPEDGVPMLVAPIGVIKDAPNPNAARLFVDWILSVEGQTAMVEVMNDYSPRSDVVSPEGFPELQDLNLIPPNFERLKATLSEFGPTWTNLFVLQQN